jgi:tRNA threonylcarbamoyladenosine biosynthesis protein TsaB
LPTSVLAVDTATEFCSVALADGERVVERAEAVGQKHSERVLPMVEALLRDAGTTLADCSAIAFGAGPGAFTGLRIACGVAQGLAFGAGRPVVAVGSLAALALVAAEAAPGARRILVAIDARMQEAYWALYAVGPDGPVELSAPALASVGELLQSCRAHRPDLVAGNALRAFPELAAGIDCAGDAGARAGAGAVARLALRMFEAGAAVAPALAAPLYVRDRVALTIDERRVAAGR